MRSRLTYSLAVAVALLIAAFYHQRTIMCQDALTTRRQAETGGEYVRADRDVVRYCFVWVGFPLRNP